MNTTPLPPAYSQNQKKYFYFFQALQLPILPIPKAVDFDYVEKRVYWTDFHSKHILRAFLNGSDIQVIKILASGEFFKH